MTMQYVYFFKALFISDLKKKKVKYVKVILYNTSTHLKKDRIMESQNA